MDLRLFFGVISRFRRQVLAGALLAVLLAALAYGTPTISHGVPSLTPRSADVWQSEAELLITQASFPYGHAAPQYLAGSGKTPPVLVGEESYMSSLAPIYVALANGDAVQATLARQGAPTGSVKAAEVFDAGTGAPMPLITLTASAPSGGAAVGRAARAIKVLQSFVSVEQRDAGISGRQRVQLQIVKNGSPAALTTGHKLTLPLLIFVVVLALTVALAFVRENMSPRTAADLGRVDGQDGEHGRSNGHGTPQQSAAAIAETSSRHGAAETEATALSRPAPRRE